MVGQFTAKWCPGTVYRLFDSRVENPPCGSIAEPFQGIPGAFRGTHTPDSNGMLPAVGTTVDIAAANWSNTIGAPEPGGVWTDPDFQAGQSAGYYVRVFEIPTPRGIVYDAFRFGVDIPEGAVTTRQERANTSPIWYDPEN